MFDFFCDTTQLVIHISCTTVNLPFSLFSVYIFPIHYLFYFAYRQYSILIFPLSLNGLLVVYDPLQLISTWFAWISHRISLNCFFFSSIFPYVLNRPWLEFPFISRHLYCTPKARQYFKVFRTDRKITNKHRALSFSTGLLCKETPVLRSAILLQLSTTHLVPGIFNSTLAYYWWKKRRETCDLVDLVYDAKVFVTSMTSLGPCLLLRGRNMAD